jgi:hypothetical protein
LETLFILLIKKGRVVKTTCRLCKLYGSHEKLLYIIG